MRVRVVMFAPLVIGILSLACGGVSTGQDFGGEVGPKNRDTAALCLRGKALYAIFDECASTCGNYSSTCTGFDKKDRYEVQTTYATASREPKCDQDGCTVRWLKCNLEPDPARPITIGDKTVDVSSLPACPVW